MGAGIPGQPMQLPDSGRKICQSALILLQKITYQPYQLVQISSQKFYRDPN